MGSIPALALDFLCFCMFVVDCITHFWFVWRQDFYPVNLRFTLSSSIINQLLRQFQLVVVHLVKQWLYGVSIERVV